MPLKLPERILAPSDLAFLEDKAKKGNPVRWRHQTFPLIDPEFEFAFEKLRDACHHSLTGPLTFHQNDEVIRVPDELVTPAFKLLIQIVEKDVG